MYRREKHSLLSVNVPWCHCRDRTAECLRCTSGKPAPAAKVGSRPSIAASAARRLRQVTSGGSRSSSSDDGSGSGLLGCCGRPDRLQCSLNSTSHVSSMDAQADAAACDLASSVCRSQKADPIRAPVVDIVAAHHGGRQAAHCHASCVAAVYAGRRVRLPSQCCSRVSFHTGSRAKVAVFGIQCAAECSLQVRSTCNSAESSGRWPCATAMCAGELPARSSASMSAPCLQRPHMKLRPPHEHCTLAVASVWLYAPQMGCPRDLFVYRASRSYGSCVADLRSSCAVSRCPLRLA